MLIWIVCGSYLFNYWHHSAENKEQYEELADIGFDNKDDKKDKDDSTQNLDETENKGDAFDYASLLAINSDCIGWLRIDGTRIDYPMVQGKDDAFYLKHDFHKEYSIGGNPFLDSRNDIKAEGEHFIIYGHQMKDGSMFKGLNEYKDKEFYKKHKEIIFYIKDQKYTYEVVSVYVTNIHKSSLYYDFLHKENRMNQLNYLQKDMAAYSLYDTGVTVKESDELLSLSTCEYSSKDGRLIVLARRK